MRILTDINSDEVAIVTTRKKNWEGTPSYDCIVGNMEYQTRVPGYRDLYTVIQNMSKQTAWLWWEFVKTRDRYTNEVKYTAESYVDKRRLTVAYKELLQLGLVRRIRRQLYMISPLAYLPEQGQFNVVKDKWETLE